MKEKQFDVVFSNPPYNSSLDLKILKKIVEKEHSICDEAIVVHTTNWLMDKKRMMKLYNECRDNLNCKSLDIIDAEIFSVKLWQPCVITHIDTSHNGVCTVTDEINDCEYVIDSLYDVSKYGKIWLTSIKPFYKILKEHIENFGNVDQHRINQEVVRSYQEDANLFYIQMSCIRGGDKGDFIHRKKTDIYNIRSRTKGCDMVIGFDTADMRENFINYGRTKFARFCLLIFKNNGNLHRGELGIIPWMDFTQEWTDEKLFEYFNISDELREYILDFVPDYYEEDYEKIRC